MLTGEPLGAPRIPGDLPGTGRELLVERGEEVARIERAVADAASERGSVLLVEAAPGLGKTRLLQVASDAAAARGFEVHQAKGAALEREFPFGVVLQLFERAVLTAPPEERARLLAGSARPLAAVLSGDRQVREDVDGFAFLHAVYWLTTNLAERAPLALVVDDAHWADPLSLRALAYLAARIADLRLLLVLAARPDEGGEALRALRREPAVGRLCPAAFSPRGVGELVSTATGDRAPAEGFVAACAEVSGGNPLLLGLLLTSLEEEGIRPTAATAAASVRHIGPTPIGRYVGASLARLSPAARELARAIAVLGERPDPRVARELAGVAEEALPALAAELEAAGVLRGEELRFAHPLVATAVYGDVPALDRPRRHRQAARLMDGTAPPDRIATHLLLASSAGEGWVVRALREAATRARALGAPDVAVRYLHRALEEPPPDEEYGEVLVETARAEVAAGAATAIETLERAIATASAGRAQAVLLLDLGRALHARGRQEEAAEACSRGIRALGEERGPLRRELETAWATAALWTPTGAEEVRARLERLLEPGTAATAGERALLAGLAGSEVVSFGDARRAVELARTAWARGAFLREGGDEASVLAIKGALTRAGQLEEGLVVAEALLADARRRGSPLAYATAAGSRGTALVQLGRLAEGQADLEAALDARRFGWELLAPTVLESLSGVLLERGDVDGAAALLVPARDEIDRLGTSPMLAALMAARGRLALARGEVGAAVAIFRAAGDHALRLLGVPNPALLSWRSDLAQALARAGDLEEARHWADEEVALTRRWGAPRPLGVALRTRASIEPAGEGLPWALEAVAVLHGSGAELELAHALVVQGTGRLHRGSPAEAIDSLRAGLDLAAMCGATVLVERARSALVAAGTQPRLEREGMGDELTAGELRVAGMAARGLSDRRIAQELFVSLKEVGGQLDRCYRKLGVRERHELRDALAGALRGDRVT